MSALSETTAWSSMRLHVFSSMNSWTPTSCVSIIPVRSRRWPDEMVRLSPVDGEVFVAGADDQDGGRIGVFDVPRQVLPDHAREPARAAARGDGDRQIVLAEHHRDREISRRPVAVRRGAEDAPRAAATR